MSALTSYKPLDTPTLNHDNKNKYYLFSLKWGGSYSLKGCDSYTTRFTQHTRMG